MVVTSSFIAMLTLLGGIICALVAVIYKILSTRIDNITKVHNDLAVNLSSIKTDIRWIKDRLNKL